MIKEELKEIGLTLLHMVKWLFLAGMAGAVIGLISVLFAKCMTFVTEFRQEHDWIIYALPLGGAVIAGLYHLAAENTSKGTNQVISAIHSQEKLPILIAPLISIATVITHLVGGSAGREGAALQLGGSIASQFSKWLHMDEKDKNLLLMCGMSAALSTLFGTPLSAAVFPMEVISVGIIHYSALLPCVTASFVANQIGLLFGLHAETFTVEGITALTAIITGKTVLLAVLCGLISILFCMMLHQSERLFEHFIKNDYVRAIVGGALVLTITLMLGTRDYMGAGIPVIERALEGEVRPEAFFLKMVLTAITLGCGFKGGEIVPSLFVGGTFGAMIGQLMGMPASLFGACGMAAVFCGVTNCPISTLFICFELFGFEGMPYYAIAVAISYLISGYHGLYHDQKIMYSKMKAEFVNRKINR